VGVKFPGLALGADLSHEFDSFDSFDTRNFLGRKKEISSMSEEFIQIYTTTSSREEAQKIAEAVVSRRLATAC
jgi:hypothetical protein